MGVAGQTATTGTGGLVGQLEADREDERQDKFDKRFAIAEQLKVGGLVMKITVIVRFYRVALVPLPMCSPQ
jgi:hypothetical protein